MIRRKGAIHSGTRQRRPVEFDHGDVDLPALEERCGRDFLERIYFHIAAFEANKLCSLRPARLDLGPSRPRIADGDR